MRSPLLTAGMLFLAATFVFPAKVRAQACPNTDYTLTTQAEVNAFPNNCARVSGSLHIEGADITDLSPLAAITSVRSLRIQFTALTSLDGLSGITSIERLYIEQNAALTSLDGLSGITSIQIVSIGNNAALTSLDGLSGITSVRDLEIRGNDALTTLDGLSGITSVGGKLQISYMPALTNLNGLSGITSVVNLIVTSSDALTSLNGLDGITTVGDRLLIEGNDALTSLDGLSGLESVRSLNVWSNDSLTTLQGLSGLKTVTSGNIWRNSALTSLDGLNAATEVGEFIIDENSALTSLDGLSVLTSVGYLVIRQNSALTSLAGLDGVSIGGLLIQNNHALVSLTGLSGLTTVDALTLRGNAALTEVDGLSGMTTVVVKLEIDGNGALTNLNGLAGLTSVGELQIEGNPNLAECSQGLYPLVSGGGVVGLITMTGNAASGDCNNDGADLVAVTALVLSMQGSHRFATAVTTVTYTYEVTNKSAFSLTNVAVEDDLLGPVTLSDDAGDGAGVLAPGDTESGTLDYVVTQADIDAGTVIRNVATATSAETDPAIDEWSVWTLNGGSLLVEAFIDGVSHLHIKQNSAQWHHLSWAAPGRHEPENFPTIINGIEWLPTWPDLPDPENRGCDCFSDIFEGVTPPLSREALQVNIQGIQVRSEVTVVQEPQPENDFELIVSFDDDGPSGADWYVVGIVTAAATDFEGGSEIPVEFALYDAYPNPFNPTTTISYDLPRLSEVTLTVYDVLGRQVEELASGTKPAGTYEVNFDATTLPSGIYFYRLQAGDYVDTKRMVVVK